MEWGTEYKVRLEMFEGPLDLLLHLIKKNELDIYDIPISIIARQYLEYVNLMKELNLEIAGEFLVMASTLLQIKSNMLLPARVEEGDAEEDEDPRAELVRRLLEYQMYKGAAEELDRREMEGRDLFVCRLNGPPVDPTPEVEELLDVQIFELIEAFRAVLARVPAETFHEVGADAISITERISEVLTVLGETESVEFGDLFAAERGRDYLIVTFLAVLELCRLKLVTIHQAGRHGMIWITRAVEDGDGDPGTEEGVESP